MAPIQLAATALAAALAMAASPAVLGQAAPGSATALQVQRLAPQLPAFAGTPSNFESLVTGLSQGTPVTLVSATPGGATQTVTFTPAGSLSPVEVARTLEAARQNLITRGIAAPSAEQIGVSLVGGSLPTPVGAASVAGVLATGSAAALPSASAGASAPASRLSITTSPSAATPAPVTGTTVPPVFPAAGPQTANPGTLPPPRFTSDSTSFGTSNSPGTRSTSHSPYFGASDSPLPGAQPRVNPALPGAPAGAAAAPGGAAGAAAAPPPPQGPR